MLVHEYSNKVPYLLKRLKTENESFWIRKGELKALSLFHDMAVRVPAYKDFLKKNKVDPNSIQTIHDFKRIPTTSKGNYLLKYSPHELSFDGVFKKEGWIISSTSGSSGEPFYFPRTSYQDKQFALTAELVFLNYFHINKKATLFIDCFALGVWIGGMFMYQAVRLIIESGKYPLSIITPGANKVETLKAVTRLAPKFDQIIIGGYGPLVKDLIDEGLSQGIKWSDYDVKYFFAAECFTEGYRDYVVEYGGARDVYTSAINHYGTADLGTMSHETALSILLRRIACQNKDLYRDIFSHAQKLPTLTQFIPELYYFEEVEGALVCTSKGGLPLVRYDLKDRGSVFSFKKARKIFKKHNVSLNNEICNACLGSTVWNLPFVYVYERNDMTVSIYSVNIYPESIRKAFEKGEVKGILTGRFTMLVNFDRKQNQYLEINVELKKNVVANDILKKDILKCVVEQLNEENSEWRDFYVNKEIRHKIIPRINMWVHQHPKYFETGGKQKWAKK